MLYTCSRSVARKEEGKMKYYYIVPGVENCAVAPDKHDLDLYRNGVITAKGFALNYDMKLRSPEAYEWMVRVSTEATHEDVALVGEEEGTEKNYLIMLAEMITNMFGGKMNFRYEGEIK